MSDILIRDLPEIVLEAIDARATRLGLSRSEYLRRLLAQDAGSGRLEVTVADLRWLADAFAGLGEREARRQVWQ